MGQGTWALVVQVLAAVGGFAGLGALVNILISRKKVANEAADIAQDTSTKLIKNLDADNVSLRQQLAQNKSDNDKDMEELREKVRELYDRLSTYETELSVYRLYIINSISWSKEAHQELVRLNSKMSPPPRTEELFKVFPSNLLGKQ